MFKMEYIAFTLIVLCSFGMDECGNMSEQSSRERVHITDATTLSSTQSNEEQSSGEREQITDATTFPSAQNKGRTSIDIILQVYIQGPNFLTPGVDADLVCTPDNTSSAIQFTWSGIHCKHISGNGRTCTLTPSIENEGRNVTCMASNNVMTSATANYTILLAYGPDNVFISGPEYIDKDRLGKELSLTCSNDGVYPNVTYSWSRSDEQKRQWNNIYDDMYRFSPHQSNDGVIVTCNTTNTRDTSKSAKTEYKLKVAYGPLNISIMGPPFINKTHLGKTVTLYCIADNVFPNVSFDWSWSYNWHRACGRGNTCTFMPQKSDDGNIVTCVVTNTRDTSKRMTTEYKINVVYGPFKAKISGPKFIDQSQLGKNITLYCNVEDVYPNATYSWTVSGTASSLKYWCSSDSTCNLIPTLEDDGKNVTCTATNERDVTIRTIDTYQIRIAYGPYSVSILGSPSFNKSQLGKNVTLNCIFDEVFPNVSYKWFWKLDKHPTSHTCNTSSTCTFVPQIQDDGKIVTCSVINTRRPSNYRSHEYKINIVYGPFKANISGPNFIDKPQLGKNITLNCNVDDVYPNARYSWTMSGTSPSMKYLCSSGSTCTLTPTLEDDGTSVTCTATNERDVTLGAFGNYQIRIAYGPSKVVIYGPPFINETVVRKRMTLNCSAVDVYPSATFSWSWCHKGHFQKEYSGNLYTFTPKEHDDEKCVTCKVNNARDSTKSATATYSLTIAYITAGNIWGPDFIVTNGSKTEKLVCNVTSVFPVANFTWNVFCNEQVMSSNDSICSVTPKISDDNKTITCTATNTRFSNLTTSASYIIRLKYPPVLHPLINNYTSDHVLQEGSKLTLTCSVSGGQPPVSSVNFSCGNYMTSKSTSNKTMVSSSIVMESLKLTDNGTVCKCSALWEPEPGYYPAVAMVTLKVVHSTGTATYLLIGATVGASIIAILAIIIALVIVIKKSKVSQTQSTNTSRQAKGRSLSDCVDHINELYGTWDKTPMTLTGTDMLNHQNTSILPPADIYAQVNKNTRHDTSRDDRSLLESEQPIYAQAQKIKPVVKIKPEIMSKHDAALDKLHES